MNIIKKTYSKNNNKIVLVENNPSNVVGLENPTYFNETISGQRKNKTILIIGVVHGDEPQGKFLIENYLNLPYHCEDDSGETTQNNRLLFIPCLNPDGLALNTRKNANGVDINRNFPTSNWEKTDKNSDYFGGFEPESEIETKFIVEIIKEFSPDIILTLHAPYKVVNYDGPAKEIAEKISEIIGYPISTDIGYSTPGSLGTYAGIEKNIPTITLELDEEIDVKELVAPSNKIFYSTC